MTSIGAVDTFTIGVLVFGDPNIAIRRAGVALILLGVILLKMGRASTYCGQLFYQLLISNLQVQPPKSAQQ